NSARALLMTQMFVRTSDGPLSTEQVLDMQRQGIELPPESELVMLSTRNVRNLLGDPNDWGARIDTPEALSASGFAIERWGGVYTEAHIERLPGLAERREASIVEHRRRGRRLLRQVNRYDSNNDSKRKARAHGYELEDQDQLAIYAAREKRYSQDELDKINRNNYAQAQDLKV